MAVVPNSVGLFSNLGSVRSMFFVLLFGALLMTYHYRQKGKKTILLYLLGSRKFSHYREESSKFYHVPYHYMNEFGLDKIQKPLIMSDHQNGILGSQKVVDSFSYIFKCINI